jgi:hypothetical protein
MGTDRLVDPVAAVCRDDHALTTSHRSRNGAGIDLAAKGTDPVPADLPATTVPGQGCSTNDNNESQSVP